MLVGFDLWSCSVLAFGGPFACLSALTRSRARYAGFWMSISMLLALTRSLARYAGR